MKALSKVVLYPLLGLVIAIGVAGCGGSGEAVQDGPPDSPTGRTDTRTNTGGGASGSAAGSRDQRR